MEHLTDLSAGEWLLDAGTSPERLITFGPAVYPAYARLRYIPDPVPTAGRRGQSEADVVLLADHPSDAVVAARAVRALVAASGSTDRCVLGVWDGYGGGLHDQDLLRGPLLELPHRRFVLFATTVDMLLQGWGDLFDSQTTIAPSLVWPTDHRWCFVSDVDPHWAGIGSDAATIRRLVDDPGLDVVPADPDEPQPTYY